MPASARCKLIKIKNKKNAMCWYVYWFDFDINMTTCHIIN